MGKGCVEILITRKRGISDEQKITTTV